MENEKYFLVSALQSDSLEFALLRKHKTEKDAVKRATEVIKLRRQQGSPEIPFFILEVKARVEAVAPKVTFTRLK